MQQSVTIGKKDRLTDDAVLLMRKVCRKDPTKSSRTFSLETGISENTLSKAIRGETYKHLNPIEPPFSKSHFKVSDQDVIAMRSMAKTSTHAEVHGKFSHLGICIHTTEKIIRGVVYKHLNDKAPPVLKDIRKTELKQKARELCASGIAYNKIASTLGVAKSSVSLWCKDIKRPTVNKTKTKVPTAPNNKAITETQKEAIRHRCREGETRQKIADDVGLHITTVHRICRGVVSKVNHLRVRRELSGVRGEYPYEDWHLYFSKDKYGAKIVNMVHTETRERMGMRYARYVMSVHLGRILEDHEMVRFKSGVDDSLDNLILTTLESEMVSRSKDRMRPCEHCGTVFEAKRTRTKYCSNTCKWAKNDSHKAADRQCRSCGESFTSESRSQRYCSEECKSKVTPKKRIRTKTKKTLPRIECVVCEGLFIPDSPGREVCYAQYCNDVISGYEE